MKKLLLILLCLPFFGLGQINKYKYIVVNEITTNYGEIKINNLNNWLNETLYNFNSNYNIVGKSTGFVNPPSDLLNDSSLALYLDMDVKANLCTKFHITISEYNNNLIYEKKISECWDERKAIKKCLEPFFSNNVIKKNITSSKSNNWQGNGSGIIISKSGYIITNHHVIDDADDIEVEFILDDEVQKFNAEIVQSDKVNDLAVIKIVDVNFDGVKDLPYNFKTRISDVGTKVYAFGYPMALSVMGKEIKVTDGIISSKTGFDGDITTYQISAPIQGGNSGGPLFDDKGNFIGINSAGIRKDVADNVGYSIKTSYILNLIDILPKSIDLPSSKKLASLPLTEQIKEITKYVVLVKVK